MSIIRGLACACNPEISFGGFAGRALVLQRFTPIAQVRRMGALESSSSPSTPPQRRPPPHSSLSTSVWGIFERERMRDYTTTLPIPFPTQPLPRYILVHSGTHHSFPRSCLVHAASHTPISGRSPPARDGSEAQRIAHVSGVISQSLLRPAPLHGVSCRESPLWLRDSEIRAARLATGYRAWARGKDGYLF